MNDFKIIKKETIELYDGDVLIATKTISNPPVFLDSFSASSVSLKESFINDKLTKLDDSSKGYSKKIANYDDLTSIKDVQIDEDLLSSSRTVDFSTTSVETEILNVDQFNPPNDVVEEKEISNIVDFNEEVDDVKENTLTSSDFDLSFLDN